MVILRKLALRVQANLGAHSSKIKNAASLLEAPFEPFNFHWDMCVFKPRLKFSEGSGGRKWRNRIQCEITAPAIRRRCCSAISSNTTAKFRNWKRMPCAYSVPPISACSRRASHLAGCPSTQHPFEQLKKGFRKDSTCVTPLGPSL